MLRTPTHIVEIGTNLNSTKTSTPLIQKLQHHHHQQQQHTTTTTTTTVVSPTAAAAGTKYQYHEHYSSTQTSSLSNNKQHKVYQLQAPTKKNAKKLKKNNKSASSSSNSSTNTSISSSDESTITASKTSSPLTFKEHFLSRGLLSASPFAFMRLRKANKANGTAAAAVTPTAAELRKSSKRLVDLVDCSSNHSNQKIIQGAIAKVDAASSATTTPPLAVATATIAGTKSTTRSTGYFANILSSNSSNSSNNSNSSNSNNSNNSIKAKNVYNTNNNNNYITSFTTTTAVVTITNVKHNQKSSSPAPSLSSSSNQSVITAASTTSSTATGGGHFATNPKTTTTSSITLPFVSFANTVVAPPTLVAVAVASPPIATTTSMSPTSQTPPAARTSLFDSCHRKIRLIGGGPVAFLGGLVAKARRKERDGDQNSTDTKLYLEESVLERKLPEADLKALVDLPAGLDYNEWLASHTLALFEHVNLVYGTISEFCTTSGCPDMTGPANRTYLWFDEKGKKTRVAAPQYIDYVMTFTQKTVSDESIFPTKYANEFPSSFESIARKILRLQFHVIAHLYAAHFREIALLGLHTHLNLTFAHLTALHRRFNLIDEKETDVLRDLEVALRLTDETSNQSGGGGGGSQSEGTDAESGKQDDVNSVQHNNTIPPSLIDGGGGGGVGGGPPICTQPEAGIKSQQFGGGGGLIGGILGDLSSGEFGDTMHYCTSAVPASSSTTCSLTSPLQNSTTTTCNATNGGDQHATTANGNNGAGALHFHQQPHNNNNHVTQQHHHQHPHHHAHHHPHHHHHPNHFAQNTGLIQCNASNAPTATAATTSTTTA